MMRPKSAMFYLNDVENISTDLTNLITETLDENQEIDDVLDYVNRWALESVVAIFLDSRLNCLKKDLPKDSVPNRFVEAVKVVTGPDGNDIAGGIPFWKYIPTKGFKRFDNASATVHEISKKMVEDAKESLGKNKDNKNLSILQKFILRCGEDSDIPMGKFKDS